MPSFLVHSISSCKFCHMFFSHCQIPVYHQLFLQHPCYSCMLGQPSSQRYLDPSFTQNAFSGSFYLSKDVQRVMISDNAASSFMLQHSVLPQILKEKILELHTFVIHCIFSYYDIV